jgi:hypothetical protein
VAFPAALYLRGASKLASESAAFIINLCESLCRSLFWVELLAAAGASLSQTSP